AAVASGGSAPGGTAPGVAGAHRAGHALSPGLDRAVLAGVRGSADEAAALHAAALPGGRAAGRTLAARRRAATDRPGGRDDAGDRVRVAGRRGGRGAGPVGRAVLAGPAWGGGRATGGGDFCSCSGPGRAGPAGHGTAVDGRCAGRDASPLLGGAGWRAAAARTCVDFATGCGNDAAGAIWSSRFRRAEFDVFGRQRYTLV